MLNEDIDDDFYSVLEAPIEEGDREVEDESREGDSRDRRASAASASTATARSFRELHRKYSSAQHRSVSAAGRLAVPSDADSEVAVSFSDGRRSPLPPMETEEEEKGTKDLAADESVMSEDEEDTTLELENQDEKQLERKTKNLAREKEPANEEAEGSESLPNRPLQAVNA
jgi:hypothetical protein